MHCYPFESYAIFIDKFFIRRIAGPIYIPDLNSCEIFLFFIKID